MRSEKVKVTSEVNAPSVFPFVTYFIVAVSVTPVMWCKAIRIRCWLFTLTWQRTKDNRVIISGAGCKGRRKSNNHWTATPPFLHLELVWNKQRIVNILDRIITSYIWPDCCQPTRWTGVLSLVAHSDQTQMEITDKKLSQIKRVVGGNNKTGNIGQYLDWVLPAEPMMGTMYPYIPYCVNIRPSLWPRVPGGHWPVPGCRVLDLQPGAARGEARRFNNEFSDNCGNSTRSEIVFNFHRNKDCLSTIIRRKYSWYRNHYASTSFLCVSQTQTQSGSCQSYCGDV